MSKNRKNGVEDVLTFKKLQAFLVETEHNYLTTHHKLCFAIIARIYRRVLQGYKFGAIKVSNKRLIVDGNHRYIAYQLAGIEFEILEATHSFCDQPERFNQIKIDTKQDWDANHPDTKKYCNDDFLTEENY